MKQNEYLQSIIGIIDSSEFISNLYSFKRFLKDIEAPMTKLVSNQIVIKHKELAAAEDNERSKDLMFEVIKNIKNEISFEICEHIKNCDPINIFFIQCTSFFHNLQKLIGKYDSFKDNEKNYISEIYKKIRGVIKCLSKIL